MSELLLLLKMIASVVFNFLISIKKNNYFVVRQLHMEFLRAGSNVMQTFTFSASEENMESKVSCNGGLVGGLEGGQGSSTRKTTS